MTNFHSGTRNMASWEEDPVAVLGMAASLRTIRDEDAAEDALPSTDRSAARLSELMEDPEPVMQQLIRVIDEGTFCPGFQFLAGGQLHPTVVGLFKRARELTIPHNYFTVSMVTPSGSLGGSRPVDLLDGGPQPLLHALEAPGREQSCGLSGHKMSAHAATIQLLHDHVHSLNCQCSAPDCNWHSDEHCQKNK